MGDHETTDFHRGRDELFSHIRRCGVLDATPQQREEWLEDTMEYVAERYPSLSRKELSELKQLGERYCRPVIPHGEADASDAWTKEEVTAGEGAEPEDVEPEAVEPEAVEPEAVEPEAADVEPVKSASE